MVVPVDKVDRIHHEWTLRFFGLLVLVNFFRLLAYYEVHSTDKLRPQVKDDVKVTKIRVPSRDKGRYITAYVYEPVNMPAGPRPVNVNIHGSGFCINAFYGNSRWFNYCVASNLQCYVIDSDYRKAPEYPFPLAIYDCQDVINWVFTQHEKFDLDRVSMTGFSAGGNLALATTNHFGPDKIKAVTSFYAPLDGSTSNASVGDSGVEKGPFRSGVIMDNFVFSVFFAAYVTLQCDPGDPRISVMNLPLERFPDHILFVAGDADTLYPESVRFYQHVMKNGRSSQQRHCRFLSVPNEARAFDEQPKCPESVAWRDKAFAQTIDLIRSSWTLDALSSVHSPRKMHSSKESPSIDGTASDDLSNPANQTITTMSQPRGPDGESIPAPSIRM